MPIFQELLPEIVFCLDSSSSKEGDLATLTRDRGRQKSAKICKDICQTPASRTGSWAGQLGQIEAIS